MKPRFTKCLKSYEISAICQAEEEISPRIKFLMVVEMLQFVNFVLFVNGCVKRKFLIIMLSDFFHLISLSCVDNGHHLLQNLHQEIELYDSRVNALLDSGQTLVEKCAPSTSASLRRSLENLSVRWENIKTRSSDRKTKLEEALKQADSFHESLNSIIVWLTNAEKTLNNVKPVSRVVESCLAQIEQHKV